MLELLHIVHKISEKVRSQVGEYPYRDAADLDELRRLIAQGTPLEDADDYGWTAFTWAIRCDLYDVAKILEQAGANTSRRADAELISAIFKNDAELVRKALLNGAKNNFVYGLSSPLGNATFQGQEEIVKVMIAAGVPVPVDALQPLGEMDITDYMIDPGEKEQRYARVAEILITHGASPNINDYEGKPLIESFPAKYYPNIHRVLSEALTRLKNQP